MIKKFFEQNMLRITFSGIMLMIGMLFIMCLDIPGIAIKTCVGLALAVILYVTIRVWKDDDWSQN